MSLTKKALSVFHQKFYSRSHFLRSIPKKSVGIELGVFKGEFSVELLRIIKPKELHLVDLWWVAFGEYSPDWGEYTDNGKLKTRDAYEHVIGLIHRYDKDNVTRVNVGDDVQYLSTFEDNYFDWAYIDSSHAYEHTSKELLILEAKVNTDGIIMGHDWRPDPKARHHGVYRAVKEFCVDYNWELIKTDYHTQWAIKRVR